MKKLLAGLVIVLGSVLAAISVAIAGGGIYPSHTASVTANLTPTQWVVLYGEVVVDVKNGYNVNRRILIAERGFYPGDCPGVWCYEKFVDYAIVDGFISPLLDRQGAVSVFCVAREKFHPGVSVGIDPSECAASTPAPIMITPTPTSTPVALSCSQVLVEGATFLETYQGQNGLYYLYSINSGATARLKAQVVPSGTQVIRWAVGGSRYLPSAGTLSYPVQGETTIVDWTAPINPMGTEEGVDIRADISEYPQAWVYCPTLTFAVRPASPVATPTPTGTQMSNRLWFPEVKNK